MADEATGTQITFNVKSSNDKKHAISISDALTVAALKEKLATSDYADIPVDRQRLIYSGRVMKDADALSVYKIKDGNTVHLVKGAASNQQRNPETGGSSASVPPSASVPQNIAAGTGNDPLAGLTGARYAGFAQMPSADTFGSDGGMNMGNNPEEMLRMLENPMFQSQMNEAMNNPQVIQMMENNPMFRDQPQLRQMIRNPEMRRLMMDPQFIRQSMRISQAMNPGGAQAGDMPAPGVTDTTPGQPGAGAAAGNTGAGSPPANPFNMFPPGMGAAGGAGGAQGNPFAALFGGMPPAAPGAAAGANTTGTNEQTGSNTDGSRAPDQQQAGANPFAGPFGQAGAQGGQDNPMLQMQQRMMQDPEMMRMAMQMMGGGDGNGAGGGFNPLAMLSGGGGGGGSEQGAGGFNPFGSAPPPAPADSRPPEEQFADQLRQLNEMGFHDFERNVRALRMAGGRVEGAIEMLFSGAF